MSDTNATVLHFCPECKNCVNSNARRCGHCGIVLSRPKRTILQLGAIFSALLVIVPIWQLAISTTDVFKNTVAFEIEPSNCTPEGIALSFANFEKDRFLEWSDVKLISINDNRFDELMTFRPNQRRHLPPLSVTGLTFFTLPETLERIKGLIKDGIATEVEMVVSITAIEPDGNRPTPASVACTWSPAQPLLN